MAGNPKPRPISSKEEQDSSSLQTIRECRQSKDLGTSSYDSKDELTPKLNQAFAKGTPCFKVFLNNKGKKGSLRKPTPKKNRSKKHGPKYDMSSGFNLSFGGGGDITNAISTEKLSHTSPLK